MFATSGRARIAYLMTEPRDGIDVLMIHAGVTDRRSWKHVIERLSPGHRCVAYDMRGYGDTSYEAEDGWSPVQDALAVLDAAELARPLIVANSMGAQAAIDLTLAHPERVAGLVLIGAAIRGAPYPEAPEGHPQRALEQELELAHRIGDRDEIAELEAWAWLDGPSARGRVTGPARELFLEMDRHALAAENPGKEAQTDDAWPRLGEIEVPTLILVGALDCHEIVAINQAAAGLIPGAKLTLLEGVAHVPHLEPDEATLEEITAFVTALR